MLRDFSLTKSDSLLFALCVIMRLAIVKETNKKMMKGVKYSYLF